MKTTYEQAFNFQLTALGWVERTEDNLTTPKSKMAYAISRMHTRVEKLKETYRAQIADLQIDHCSVDEKGNILRDEQGNYKFTRESLKQLNKATAGLFGSDVEIEPYFATQIPDGLTELEQERFLGFVLETIPIKVEDEANAATVQ